MVRTISANEARQRFDELLKSFDDAHETVIVEDDGKPVYVMISPSEYEELREERVRRAWDRIERLRDRNDHFDFDEVLADVTAAVEEVRQEMYDERRQRDQRGH